jgi:hypothetical protein
MSSNLFKCKPRQARQFIIECLQAGLVPSVVSSPGMGKSSIVKGIAKDFELTLIDHRVSTSEPVDATGIPRSYFDEQKRERSRYVPFDLFPLEGDPIPKGKRGWLLFFDEFNAAPRQTQAAHYKIVLDRMIGQYRMHKDVGMVMAGNLATDRAVVNQLSTAMQSRLVHIELMIDFLEWLEDVAMKENYDSRIIGFLSQWPGKLMDFRPDHQERTFCCPRTWEFVNKLITGIETDNEGNIVKTFQKPVNDETALLLTGTITSGIATEFVQFAQVYSQLISIKDIQKDPKNCTIPKDINLMWAVITHMMEKVDDKNFDDLATYADRFNLSFRILFYRMIIKKRPTLRSHPKWGSHVAKIMNYLTGPMTWDPNIQ